MLLVLHYLKNTYYIYYIYYLVHDTYNYCDLNLFIIYYIHHFLPYSESDRVKYNEIFNYYQKQHFLANY
jgi:hypothetical protein